MGKWGKYLKHYNEKWEKEDVFKAWLEPSSEDAVNSGKGEAFCKLCCTNLRAHRSDLLDHKKSKKHQAKESALATSSRGRLENFGYVRNTNGNKDIDIKLSMYVAMHASIASIDHLGMLLKVLGKGSKLENLRLHRTKCTKIMSNVIAPSFIEDIVKDMKETPYAIIVDESTDVSTVKFLAICASYFSKSSQIMRTEFLGMVEIPGATAEALYSALTEFLKKIGLPLKYLSSLGTDGAANLCGRNHSLFSLLRDRDTPQLQLIKCICHAIDNCASAASEALPCSLEYLIRESKNFFSHSYKRLDQYGELYKAMNNCKKPKRLVSLCDTRWLIWYPAVKQILDQWLELKTFFHLVTGDKNFTARTLDMMYQDQTNLLYLTFLKPLLRDINEVNLLFQSSRADIAKLYSDLRTLVFSLAGRFLPPRLFKQPERKGILRMSEIDMLKPLLMNEENFLPVDRVDYGTRFQTLADSPNLGVSEVELNEVRGRCRNYLAIITRNLLEKLPHNIEQVQKLRFLTPGYVLSESRPSFQELPFTIEGVDMDLVENQWRTLGTLSIRDIFIDRSISADEVDTIEFWARLLNFKNCGGKTPYKELAELSLKALTLPVSNAVVERVFSVMNTIKTKLRNRMQLNLLESIILIRIHLRQVTKGCCLEFQPSTAMLNRFNHHMYDDPTPRTSQSSSLNNDEEEEEDLNFIRILTEYVRNHVLPLFINGYNHINYMKVVMQKGTTPPNSIHPTLFSFFHFTFYIKRSKPPPIAQNIEKIFIKYCS